MESTQISRLVGQNLAHIERCLTAIAKNANAHDIMLSGNAQNTIEVSIMAHE